MLKVSSMVTITTTTLLLSACGGSARIHFQDEHGGVLALEGSEDSAMENATKKMMMHCGGPYKIEKRETVIVGQETVQNSYTDTQESTDYERAGVAVVAAEGTTDMFGNPTASAAGGEFEAEVEDTSASSNTNTTQTSYDLTEPRVHYRCAPSSPKVAEPSGE